MGLSRETFYCYHRAVEEGGVEAILERDRRKPNIKNRVDELTEQAVLSVALEYPVFGQLRASNELRKRGVFVSPCGVRSIWLRHKLESMKKRLMALEKAADLLNDHILRLLTDRGTEFCGKTETYDYELYLAVNDIEHTKTKANHPQTNGIC